MTSPAVEVAKRLWGAIQTRDLDEFLSMIDPDVEFISFFAGLERETYRGHEGVREWWNGVYASLGGLRFEPRSFEAVGDRWVSTPVVVIGTADGVDVEQAIWQVAEVVDGKATWWGSYGTEREARDALDARLGE